jgi:small-conductance mechanosensitive channel/CRP-like cAMP-binding protein
MTFWQALVSEARQTHTIPLIVGLVFTAVIARLLAPHERRRIGAIAFLVSIQLMLVVSAAILREADVHIVRDVRMIGLIATAIGFITMFSSVIGALMSRTHVRVPTIVRDVLAGAGAIVSVFVIAARMDVALSGVVATSAVVTYVIGIAFQDALGNLIAGLTLQTDDSLQIGDWVKIDDVSGEVREVRWRYTAIETRNWETVLVPNSQLMKGKVLIQGRREGKPRQWRRWVWFNVDFRTPPTQVIHVVQEALHDCHIEYVATDPAPQCILMELGESYGKYAVRYWLTDPRFDDPTDSVIRTRVYFALQRDHIPPSMPAVAAFLTEESAERKATKERVEHDHRKAILARIDLFSALPDDVLDHLADGLRPAPFAAGEVMTRQGAEAHWLYLVVSGQARVLVSTEGAPPVEIAKLKAGNFFGEMSLLTGQPRNATVIAETFVDCYRLDRVVAAELLRQRPQFAQQLAEVLATRQVDIDHLKENLDKEAHAQRVKDTTTILLERIRHFFALDEEEETTPTVANTR